ncbi:hypothetical protein [Ferrimonas balearica]|uniref:hypothetical protein n=1 Tax=Ferrimonas balearica TaxID=44012 RepID=UPI001C99C686|nr:hypothetical protein [Ferrimonas balearica]MBY5923366.1 hypothetical protein [Ferrimonas balearica]MBY5995324.1 hypothetical protein [Ferrimonas balearica]
MKLIPMRLLSTLMLIVALISQGAVARVHLMPDMSPTEMSAMHAHHEMAAQASHASQHDEMAHCKAQPVASHDCCESMVQPADCHDASTPCNGECGMCKVFSPAGVALLTAALQPWQPSPERALPQPKFFHSVALSQDSKPPIA